MRQTQAEFAKRQSEGLLPSEFIVTNDLADLKANFLLEELEGQIALRSVYWFLLTYGDSLQEALQSTSTDRKYAVFTGESSKPIAVERKEVTGAGQAQMHSSKVAPTLQKSPQPQSEHNSVLNSLRSSPWTKTYHKVPSTVHGFHFVNKHRTFDEVTFV